MKDDNKKDEVFDIVKKRKYEQAFIECKNLKTFIKTVVGSNNTVLSEQEYHHVQAECRNIINAYEI